MKTIEQQINEMSAQWAKERAESQLTLGKLIDFLKIQDENKEVEGLGELHSYRGYYSDLSFEPTYQKEAIFKLLTRCLAAMGENFTGYKGGDYQMGRNTPLWVAPYGRTGMKLMALHELDGAFIVDVQQDD